MTAHDEWEPKLRVRASGYSGSGYRIPTWLDENGKPTIVPGVTTVLGALDKPGVVQWAVDHTAAYAVANVDSLLQRDEYQGFNMLRWYHRKTPDFDDPTQDLRDYSNGVLDDAANLGTFIHDWIASNVLDMFEQDPLRDEHTQMIESFLDWRAVHYVEPLAVEKTVVNTQAGYAGTLDGIWMIACEHEGPCLGPDVTPGEIVPVCIDVKSSRALRDSHVAQLSALGAANTMMEEVDADHAGAVEYTTKQWGTTYWVEDVVPGFDRYAVLQVRPDDVDKNGTHIPSFCKLHLIPQQLIDLSYDTFLGALKVRHSERKIKEFKKSLEKAQQEEE